LFVVFYFVLRTRESALRPYRFFPTACARAPCLHEKFASSLQLQLVGRFGVQRDGMGSKPCCSHQSVAGCYISLYFAAVTSRCCFHTKWWVGVGRGVGLCSTETQSNSTL
ncbi:unnamed protein product, partial [Ectocarpus sp. 12 AP-2014]